MTTSLIPVILKLTLAKRLEKLHAAVKQSELTWILSVLGADVVVASVQNIFVHERGAWRNLPEERHLDGFADLDTLALLHEYLPGVLAAVFSVQTRHAVLLGVMAFLERLQRSHEVVTTSDTMCDDALGDTGCDGTFNDGCD